MLTMLRIAICVVTLCFATGPSIAQPVAGSAATGTPSDKANLLATDVNETVTRIPVNLMLQDGQPWAGDMALTHFRPNGPGPFPVVVFNHGRTAATRHDPARWRLLPSARFWTRRGFAVMIPTRVGYGELGQAVDPEASGTCTTANFEPAVEAMATQIVQTIDFARTLPWIDASRVLIVGVSYGGFGTIGAIAKPIPGLVGAINFAGGLGGNPLTRPAHPCQSDRVTEIATRAGEKARVPTLWIYSENDQYWGRDWPKRWRDAFVQAGGTARLVTFPPVGDDGHKIMSSGFGLWRPVVDGFVSSLGFKLPVAKTKLPASGFARVDEVGRVPFIQGTALTDGYAKFLASDVPRAFALAPSGAWAWRSGLDAVDVALTRCQDRARGTCSLYAVDDRVVWKDPAAGEAANKDAAGKDAVAKDPSAKAPATREVPKKEVRN